MVRLGILIFPEPVKKHLWCGPLNLTEVSIKKFALKPYKANMKANRTYERGEDFDFFFARLK